jgi:flagellar hook-associated protein 2
MGSVSSLGIGSGILTNDLLDDIVSSQREPAEKRLNAEQKETEAKLSAFGQFRSAVSSLEGPADALTDPSALRNFKGESSSDAISVSVDDSAAQKGSYSVDVNQVAEAQALASATYADRDSTAIGTGDLTFNVGDQSKTITLDDSNNTLNGLASEINESDMGVNASILNTGDGYRMVLNADDTGTANAMSITANGDADLDAFNFNDTTKNLEETRAAKDAIVDISGVEVTRSSNTIEGVIDGVTLNISGETDLPSDVNVTQDLEEPTSKVQALVDGFNKVQGTANELTSFDQEAGEGSILTGDSTIRSTMNQLRREFSEIVPGLEDASVRSLADIGISTDFNTGQLQFDSAKFQEKLQQNPDDVTALFANQGRASDGQVEFVRSTGSTQPGDYDVNVDSLATRGSFTGNALAAGDITIDDSNNTFSLKLNDGNEAQVTLTNGTYSNQQLLEEVRTQVADNTTIQSGEDSLQVDLTGNGELQFTSSEYGSDSSVEITQGNADLGLATGTGTAGTDAQGTIDGQQAEGDGQVLFLGRDQGEASGIQVRVRGGETGDRGSISYIEGVGNNIADRISQLEGRNGALSSREESFQTDLEDIQEERQDLNERFTSLRERLSSQFASADQRISQFQQTGNYLQQQLAGLSGGGN